MVHQTASGKKKNRNINSSLNIPQPESFFSFSPDFPPVVLPGVVC